jgi:arylsulfatase
MKVHASMVAVVVLSAAAAAADASPPRSLPNIVLILTDDQGYADVGCFGAKGLRTPHLDRLAKEGTRFTSFYVSQPVCTASRASLLTGCYANRVGLEGALNPTSTVGIADDEVLLSEICKSRGYSTAVYGKWHLGHQPKFHPFRHGFDDFFGIPYPNDVSNKYHPVIRTFPPLPLIDGERVVAEEPDQSQFTRQLTERAVAFIERNTQRPFFLYLAHIMPHVPIFASERFRGRSRRGLYGDVIEELDWSVGEVVAALRRHRLDENTFVIFTSDNGPFLSYGDHAGSAGPFRGGKLTAFEGGVRMPTIMRWPGHIPAGGRCPRIVSSLDLLPTIARQIGAPLPPHPIDGVDVSELLFRPEAESPRKVFLYYAGSELHAVRSGDWKLHLPHRYLEVAGAPGQSGKPSNWDKLTPEALTRSDIEGIASRHGYRLETIGLVLYNLEDDPGETHDVAAAHPDVVKRLSALAEEAREDLGDSLVGRPGRGVRPPGRVE